MITGDRAYVEPYVNPAILREDYLRRVVQGGLGEGAWNAAQCEMLVNGTIPVDFTFGPPEGEVWAVESVQYRYIYNVGGGGGPLEFGSIGNPLARYFYLMLWNGPAVAANALVGIINNGDFLKMGSPFLADLAAGVNTIYATWRPSFPILLRGNEYEVLWVSINSDLTVAGAGITLSAMAKAYKVVG